MTLGYPRNDMVLGFQDHRLWLWLGVKATAIRRGFELYEYLLVRFMLIHEHTMKLVSRDVFQAFCSSAGANTPMILTPIETLFGLYANAKRYTFYIITFVK